MKQLIVVLFLLVNQLAYVFGQCEADCVWPGDHNANGIANSLDILALGLAWGETGPPRANTTTNWEALEADDWAGSLPLLGTNFKHCDSDGDGELTLNDQFPISINYNQTNANFTGLLGNELVGNDLFIVPQNTVATPGGSLIFDIHLGTAADPISDLHGIGFQLDMDTQYVSNVLFDFSDSWIGSDDDILGYGKYSGEFDHAGTAITRLDGNTVGGFGKIAQIEIVIIDVILAISSDTTACLPFPIQFKNVLGINGEEEDLMITSQEKALLLKHPSQLTNIAETPEVETVEVKVFPNPTEGRVFVQSPDQAMQKLVLFNTLGQTVFQHVFSTATENRQQFELMLSSFSSGCYFLAIHTKHQKIIKKIILE